MFEERQHVLQIGRINYSLELGIYLQFARLTLRICQSSLEFPDCYLNSENQGRPRMQVRNSASPDRTATEIYAGRRYRPRSGLSIPSVTILDERGQIIEDEQRAVFRFNAQLGLGADIIFAGGTNGEWNRITNSERQRLARICVTETEAINAEIAGPGRERIEAWVGVTSETKRETLANIECAIKTGVDAVVIAPLSIRDLEDIVDFFQRDVSDLFDHTGRSLPIFLYDNANIAADPGIPHIHTRDVKRLSRLPFIYGLKVSAPRRVLGNYTKGALHYREKGEFGVYVGDALLMFQVFNLQSGITGTIKEYWNRYLLHNEFPIGVVSGPANVLPREWQRAWRACHRGDERLMAVYLSAFQKFSKATKFDRNGKRVSKTIACLKLGLKLQGAIATTRVGEGTATLSDDEAMHFTNEFLSLKKQLEDQTDPMWISRV